MRLLVILGGLLAAGLLLVPLGGVGKTRTLATTDLAFRTISFEAQRPVEQQTPGLLLPCPAGEPNCATDQSLWVVNNTGGNWDIDDHWIRGGGLDSSTVIAHQTVMDHLTYIGDCDGLSCGPSRMLTARVLEQATSPGLTVTVSVSPGQSYPLIATLDMFAHPRTWQWVLPCQQMQGYVPTDPAMQDIPDSNGGRGVPTVVSMSVANPTDRDLGRVYASYGISAGGSGRGC